MKFYQDYLEFLRLLNKNRVEYMIVGGYAMAFHGHPRFTGDIDVWIKISESNAEKMERVLIAFGFSVLNFKKKDFLKKGMIFQIGYQPVRIDIITSIEGVSFEEAFLNRHETRIGNLKVGFIGLKDLIKNKKSVGRDIDLIDFKTLSGRRKKK